jgi:hypothetical protein
MTTRLARVLRRHAKLRVLVEGIPAAETLRLDVN